MSRSSRRSSRCISPISTARRGSPRRRRRSSKAWSPAATAVLNRDNKWFDLLAERARDQRRAHRLLRRASRPPTSASSASRSSRMRRASRRGSSASRVTYRLGAPGRHLVQNSLAVLAAAHAVGADMARVLLALAQIPRAEGAGRATAAYASCRRVHADRRELQRQPGLHARRAGAARPGEPAGPRAPYRRPRRHAGARRGGAGAASRRWRRRSSSRAPTSCSSPGR